MSEILDSRCHGKKRYTSWRAAREVAKTMKRCSTPHAGTAFSGKAMRPYLCPGGDHWHLTSKPD